MPEFPVNPHRRQPYANFKFRVKWDGRHVAGVSRVSALTRTTDVVRHRSGADPNTEHRSPGRSHYEPVTLERGVTHDQEFERWATRVHDPGAGTGAEVKLADYRKDVVLELANEAGQVVMAYHLYGCWPSTFTALPELDANGNSQVAIQQLVLQVEGWERDEAVTEPSEPGGDG
jgi:phage tail-like protein